jgi:thiol-disulfide isomerase/thioredoxin
MFRIGLALSAVLFTASLAHAAGDKDPLIGQEAPNLIGRAAFGAGLIKLDKLKRDVVFELDEKGKPIKEGGKYKSRTVDYVVVMSFFATYCVPCVKEIPTFNKIAKSYEDQPVRFIYVNVDTEKTMEQIVRFGKERGIEVEMMLPSVKNAIDLYKIEHLPRMVFVDKKGIVVQVLTGFQDDLPKQIDEILKPLLSQT